MANRTVQQTRMNAAVREAEQAQDKVEKAQATLERFTRLRDTALGRATWLEGMPVDDAHEDPTPEQTEKARTIQERLEALRRRIAGEAPVEPEPEDDDDLEDQDDDLEDDEEDEDQAPE